MPTLTTQDIAAHVAGRLVGPPDIAIHSAETLDRAQAGHISFIGDAKYVAAWTDSKASAALVSQSLDVEPGPGRAIIKVANADLAMAQVLDLLAPPVVRPAAGVHPTAVVDASARLGADVAVGAHCVIGAHAHIADGVVLHPRVTILDECRIGPGCILYSGVVVRERCSLGARCILHPNVVLGADGFGYRPVPGGKGLVKITHIGTVELHDDVELGAGTCVDRGKFSATVIGAGTKIDNLCQIGHNVRIGRMCVLSGQVGLAGSVVLGDSVMMGGKAGVRDHVTIGSRAKVMAYAAVMDDIPPGETWGGYPAQEKRGALREHLAARKLPDLIKQIETWLADQRKT